MLKTQSSESKWFIWSDRQSGRQFWISNKYWRASNCNRKIYL